MNPTSTVDLEFNPERDDLGKEKELRNGLSVALQIGNTLWVANDESISLERLSLIEGGNTGNYKCGRHHKQFPLDNYIQLPERLPMIPRTWKRWTWKGWTTKTAISGWAGSHSLKRKKPTLKDGAKEAQKQSG